MLYHSIPNWVLGDMNARTQRFFPPLSSQSLDCSLAKVSPCTAVFVCLRPQTCIAERRIQQARDYSSGRTLSIWSVYRQSICQLGIPSKVSYLSQASVTEFVYWRKVIFKRLQSVSTTTIAYVSVCVLEMKTHLQIEPPWRMLSQFVQV